jgi:hypothetical protein
VVALACLLTGLLVAGTLPPHWFSDVVGGARTAGARAWLSSHLLCGRVRAVFERLFDATADESPTALARPLRAVLEKSAPKLSEAARMELAGLLARVT